MNFNKICPVCNKIFITRYERVKCCSLSCAGKYKEKKGKIIKCLKCGTEVYSFPHENKKFCSVSCSSIVNNGGDKNGRYIDGRCKIFGTFYSYIRGIKECTHWRNNIFLRDNFTCKECNTRGGKLHAHHKRQLKYIIQDFLNEYSEYSPIDDKEILIKLAISYAPFWDLNNGETLCEDCHKLVRHDLRR